jgi:hypothetical protein
VAHIMGNTTNTQAPAPQQRGGQQAPARRAAPPGTGAAGGPARSSAGEMHAASQAAWWPRWAGVVPHRGTMVHTGGHRQMTMSVPQAIADRKIMICQELQGRGREGGKKR